MTWRNMALLLEHLETALFNLAAFDPAPRMPHGRRTIARSLHRLRVGGGGQPYLLAICREARVAPVSQDHRIGKQRAHARIAVAPCAVQPTESIFRIAPQRIYLRDLVR